MAAFRIAVLISGNGGNLQALLDAQQKGFLSASVEVVVSSSPEAYGLQRAQRAGVPTHTHDWRVWRKANPNKDRSEFDQEIVATLRHYAPDLVVLAGWMLLVTPVFLDAFPQRVINLHPSLLPSFPGAHAVDDALAAGVRYTGCTVHFVDTGMDTGAIIGQSVVPVMQDDTRDALANRIHEQEHRLLPEVVTWFSEGKVQISQGRVHIL